jgi:sec-independent protein translocase protein TatA
MMFAFLPNLGPTEMIVILVIAVLLFGKRLPEVGRSVGKSIVEFKKGMRGVEDEIHRATYAAETPKVSASRGVEHEQPTAPKFEPPAANPEAVATSETSNV